MSTSTIHVLVVCTGNICRSPMAERLLADYALRRGRSVTVRSASVLGLNGKPAHKHAIAVMKQVGMDLSDHRAQPVTQELIDWSDYVLGMEIQHSAKLRERYPGNDDKFMLLGSFGGVVEVADPLGHWRPTFRKCRDQLTRCSQNFVDQLPTS